MKLHYLNGPKSGESVLLAPPAVTLGRETDNDLSLLVAGISRYHAKMQFENNIWTIRDLGSTNGTKVDGALIAGSHTLKGGELIALGDQTFKFEAENAGAQTPAPAAVATPPTNPTAKIDVNQFMTASNPNEATVPDASIKRPDPSPIMFTPTQSAPAPATPAPATPAAPSPAAAAPMAGATQSMEMPHGGVFSSNSLTEEPVQETPADAKTEGENPFAKMNFFGSNGNSESGIGADGKKKSSFLVNALFYVGVIFAAIILIMVFLKKQEQESEAPIQVVVKKEPPFLLLYEKQVTGKDNIFRYSMLLEGEKATITIDDLRYERHMSVMKNLTDDQLDSIKSEVRSADFLDLAPVQKGSASGYEDDTRKITISIDGKMNSVTVKNNFAPNSFMDIERSVEELSSRELGVKSVTLTPEEMLTEAQNAFDIAEDKFDNYEAYPMNLAIAIRHYTLTMDYLNAFTKKPEYWSTARTNKQKAERLLDEKVKALLFNADKSYRLYQFEDARQSSLAIMRMVDENDSRYERARKRVNKLDDIIRSTKKK